MPTANYFSWIVPTVPDTSPVGDCSDKPSKHGNLSPVPVVPTLKYELDKTMDENSTSTAEAKVAVEKLSDNSEREVKWDPELAAQGYLWCQDCQFFNGSNCDSNDNPFKTVEKQPAAPRKCQWYEENP